ncbi:HIT family protein [Vulgatibacter sp.]|uniref:HIT family protein n=1 Tax=Vulgatibacter sp. TaxID=1971226 RepID=UPI003567AB4D
MPTLFTRIIDGELPGRFVWKDDEVVAFMTIAPVKPGHVLVVPRQEIDHWIDMPEALAHRVMTVSQIVGKAIEKAFSPERVGVMVAGLEVPHVHIHLIPIDAIADLDFSKQDRSPDPAQLDQAAEKVRAVLRQMGRKEVAA